MHAYEKKKLKWKKKQIGTAVNDHMHIKRRNGRKNKHSIGIEKNLMRK